MTYNERQYSFMRTKLTQNNVLISNRCFLATMSTIQNVPVIQEEAILEENINEEVDKALHSHAEEVLPEEVPVEGVRAVVFTWRA